jgi:CheY-like chemotaxis protein
MPEMDGEALIRALRAERPGLPVVVVTGSPPWGGAEALRRHGGGHGPLVLLHKPVDHDALLVALRRVAGPEAALPAGHGPEEDAIPAGLLAAE